MRLCDIVNIKSAFMEKTDLSEEEIQTIIDDIPTAFDGDKVIEQLEEYGTCTDKCLIKVIALPVKTWLLTEVMQ